MGAWGYSQRQDALDKMESILLQMEKSYEETLEADMRPNTVSYVTVRFALLVSHADQTFVLLRCFATEHCPNLVRMPAISVY